MKEQLKKIFDENADCYFTQAMQSAMTSDKFIEVVSELMKPTDTWVSIKSEDDLPKDDGIYLIDCEHGVTMAEFSRYGNGNTSWWAVTAIGTYEDSEGAKKVTAWMPLPTQPPNKLH